MKTKQMLLEDAIGSILYKFFNRIVTTHESEESLVSMLWRAVSLYRETGVFSTAIVVCPPYSPDYKSLDVGRVSVTALRAIKLYKLLKQMLGQHIKYTRKVRFSIEIFNEERRQYEHMGIDGSEADQILAHMAYRIGRMLRKTGILPSSFSAGLLVRECEKKEWGSVFLKACSFLEHYTVGEYPFKDPEVILAGMHDFYTRVLGCANVERHRDMFYQEEAPCYLSTGIMLRRKIHPGVIQIDVGSNPDLSRLNLWQPESEGEYQPALIRIKNPGCLDP